MEADIVVRGEGQASTMPDRAIVQAVIEADGASRDDAYTEAARLAKAVDDVVAARNAAIERSATTALVVHPTSRWKRGEHVKTGWRASRTSTLEIVDLTEVGDVIAELAGAGAAVSGPHWRVDPDAVVHGEARRLAAIDARRRAGDYAAALGLEIEAVTWVAEPGLRNTPDGRVELRHAALATPVSARGDGDVIAVTPDELAVHAAVDVGFSVRSTSAAGHL